MKMKSIYKNTAIKRSVAMILALIMIFMSVNTSLLVHADPDTRGVGINNTVYRPASDNTPNRYELTFHSDITGLDVSLPGDIIIDAANGVYLNRDGTLEVMGSQVVRLSDNETFLSFISDNKITDITITFDDGGTNLRKDFYCYSSHTQSYNLLPDPTDPDNAGNIYDITAAQTPVYQVDEQGNTVLDENDQPVIDHYENTYTYTFNETKFKNRLNLKNYRSSLITDFEVDVHWFDKDSTLRPDNFFRKSDFTFERTPENGSAETPPVNQISLSGSRHANSNLDVYSFAVPMYSSSGKLYTYTVTNASEANENYLPPRVQRQ